MIRRVVSVVLDRLFDCVVLLVLVLGVVDWLVT